MLRILTLTIVALTSSNAWAGEMECWNRLMNLYARALTVNAQADLVGFLVTAEPRTVAITDELEGMLELDALSPDQALRLGLFGLTHALFRHRGCARLLGSPAVTRCAPLAPGFLENLEADLEGARADAQVLFWAVADRVRPSYPVGLELIRRGTHFDAENRHMAVRVPVYFEKKIEAEDRAWFKRTIETAWAREFSHDSKTFSFRLSIDEISKHGAKGSFIRVESMKDKKAMRNGFEARYHKGSATMQIARSNIKDVASARSILVHEFSHALGYPESYHFDLDSQACQLTLDRGTFPNSLLMVREDEKIPEEYFRNLYLQYIATEKRSHEHMALDRLYQEYVIE